VRSLAAVLPIAVAALLPLTGPAPAALPECPPEAPPEFTCVFIVDDHFVDTETCGFEIAIDAVGKVLYNARFSSDGELVGELIRPSIKVHVTGVESGRTLTDRDVGLDKAVIAPDGSAEVLSTGIHFKVRTGDRDTIFRRIGLQIIHVDAEGNQTIEVIGGNFQPLEDFEPLACGYLTP
jgi:hypothetical protein